MLQWNTKLVTVAALLVALSAILGNFTWHSNFTW
jgi:hypothetical protein